MTSNSVFFRQVTTHFDLKIVVSVFSPPFYLLVLFRLSSLISKGGGIIQISVGYVVISTAARVCWCRPRKSWTEIVSRRGLHVIPPPYANTLSLPLVNNKVPLREALT